MPLRRHSASDDALIKRITERRADPEFVARVDRLIAENREVLDMLAEHDQAPAPPRHDWECMGGAGGWEVWQCRRCGRDTIPSPFGFLWPDVLRFVLRKRFGCSNVERALEGNDG